MTAKQLDLDLNEPPQGISLVSLCRFVVGSMMAVILCLGVMIATQTQEHHQTFQDIQTLKRDLVKMKVEESRLLIEQQTFSATPQVARRAVGELGMFYPTKSKREIMVSPSGQTTGANND